MRQHLEKLEKDDGVVVEPDRKRRRVTDGDGVDLTSKGSVAIAEDAEPLIVLQRVKLLKEMIKDKRRELVDGSTSWKSRILSKDAALTDDAKSSIETNTANIVTRFDKEARDLQQLLIRLESVTKATEVIEIEKQFKDKLHKDGVNTLNELLDIAQKHLKALDFQRTELRGAKAQGSNAQR